MTAYWEWRKPQAQAAEFIGAMPEDLYITFRT